MRSPVCYFIIVAAFLAVSTGWTQLVIGDQDLDSALHLPEDGPSEPQAVDGDGKSAQRPECGVRVITKIRLGNMDCKNPITVYVAPSCLHCGKFLLETLPKFLAENKHVGVSMVFLPTSAKDMFLMKLIQNEVKDENGYYIIFRYLIKTAMEELRQIKPTNDEKSLFKGSNSDPEMLQYQVLTSRLGFSDEKIVNAIPNMDDQYEVEVVEHYKKSAIEISDILDTKDIVLPLIMFDGKRHEDLGSIPKDKLQQTAN
jgi:hypothetical protein